jgi:hypothetical protein
MKVATFGSAGRICWVKALIDVGAVNARRTGGSKSLPSFAEVFEEQRPRALRLAYAMTETLPPRT